MNKEQKMVKKESKLLEISLVKIMHCPDILEEYSNECVAEYGIKCQIGVVRLLKEARALIVSKLIRRMSKSHGEVADKIIKVCLT